MAGGDLQLTLADAPHGSTGGENQTMTGFRILSAAAMLSMTLATMFAAPVFAQAAIQEPGAYAFYHPDGDVLEAGISRPHQPAGAFASVPLGDSGAYAAMDRSASASSCAQRYRSYDPQTGTFLGYDGARHPCL
jgi:BA14K-like protein